MAGSTCRNECLRPRVSRGLGIISPRRRSPSEERCTTELAATRTKLERWRSRSPSWARAPGSRQRPGDGWSGLKHHQLGSLFTERRSCRTEGSLDQRQRMRTVDVKDEGLHCNPTCPALIPKLRPAGRFELWREAGWVAEAARERDESAELPPRKSVAGIYWSVRSRPTWNLDDPPPKAAVLPRGFW